MRRSLLLLLPLLFAGALLFTPTARPAPATKPASATKPPPATKPAPAAPRLEADPPDSFTKVARVIAIGDVHGDFATFQEALRLASLIDAKGRWTGGKTHLVQTGDVSDRGDDTRQVLDLLMRLEAEAPSAGGRVHALLGNHEVMNMTGDLRYLTPKELASYADQSPTPDPPGQPKGLNGHRAAFSLEGRYGRWLRTRPAVIRIDRTLFVHGGIAPSVPAKDLKSLNRWIRQDLFAGHGKGGGVDPNGPLWFRGYAMQPEPTWQAGLEEVLSRFGADRMVMGHTVTESGRIEARFGGRALFIDTGLSRGYGHHLAALEIRGATLTALYPAGPQKLAAPTGPTPPVQQR